MTLAEKYRPNTYEDVCGQSIITKILSEQVKNNNVRNAYLFQGASGCGKTTCARIFANEINHGNGNPIEIDAASNNGVDNIRNIVKQASERSLDSEYKVIILDECHSLTSQSWQALLKCIEETPKYTIFIFCTTEKDKVPQTIKNRCMIFNFPRIKNSVVNERLVDICRKEGFSNYEESCDYISRICNGEMRYAISMLEKCSTYSKEFELKTTKEILEDVSSLENILYSMLMSVLTKNREALIKTLHYSNSQNVNASTLVEKSISFVLDIYKYKLLGIDTFISKETLNKIISNVDDINALEKLLSKLLQVKTHIKQDINPYATLTISLLEVM